jgi:hypothetical protein
MNIYNIIGKDKDDSSKRISVIVRTDNPYRANEMAFDHITGLLSWSTHNLGSTKETDEKILHVIEV